MELRDADERNMVTGGEAISLLGSTGSELFQSFDHSLNASISIAVHIERCAGFIYLCSLSYPYNVHM